MPRPAVAGRTLGRLDGPDPRVKTNRARSGVRVNTGPVSVTAMLSYGCGRFAPSSAARVRAVAAQADEAALAVQGGGMTAISRATPRNRPS